MSGGHFGYSEFRLNDIAGQIEDAIKDNGFSSEWEDANNFSPETLKKFKKTVKMLRKTSGMVHRIDYLLSGDDSEESFHKRWADEKLP